MQLNGVVRDVFVQIGQDKQQFEHTVALPRIGHFGAIVKVVDDHERVREKPLERFRVHRPADAATLKGLVRANESLVEEMIEAKAFGRQRLRNRVVTRVPPACH